MLDFQVVVEFCLEFTHFPHLSLELEDTGWIVVPVLLDDSAIELL
jgi:hypothetical protein